MSREIHTIPPVFDSHSKILILGSFPSVKSRESQFFYGHPQNRFWRVLAAVTGQPLPSDIAEKKEFLLRNHIALWDVIESCEITGSSDSSIRNAVPNNLNRILCAAPVYRQTCPLPSFHKPCQCRLVSRPPCHSLECCQNCSAGCVNASAYFFICGTHYRMR